MWLANPLHKIREEWVQALTLRLELYNEQEQLNECDLSVIVAMISILLRNTTPQTCPALPTITLLLKCMAEGGMSAWIEREILFEPLFHLLEDESLLRREPKTLLRIVETFLCATAADTKENAGGSPLEGIQQGSTASISSRLVGLGITPVLNTLLQRLLNLEAASADEEADSTFVRHSIMSAVCGIYRNLSAGYAHHLREVGTVELLLAVLEAMAAYTVIVAAASRALVKFVFDVDSLRALRDNNRVISAAATALAHQISLRKTKQSIRTEDREQGEESEASYLLLLVSRLCSVIGLVVQGSPSHREYFVQHHTSLLEELVNQFVANTPHRPPLPGASSPISDGGEQGEMTVVQGAVWLVGVAATSPHCNLEFVMRVAAMLVRYLTELEFTPATRLNAIYVLMCISNLSCHFHRMEDDNESSDELLELFNTLGPILAGFLFEGDVEATVEATRVLGNVSYTSAGRDWMEANRCDEVVVIFAGHEDLRIVYNCFGILLNLTAGTRCRVVEDPQLLKMLLQHTDRYTRRDDIDKAAAEEGSRLRQTQGAGGGLHRIHNLTPLSPRDLKDAGSSATSIDAPEALAKDYAEQTADLVEKLLMNVKGLVLCAADEEAEESEEES
ncbi:unnamed protein product [Phytomonas sp. EM1]|nr:unnamed protein product [Phytomonas sp. EM1]|eukprot:CCW60873.1 unnamed protein product [Phytomonas sp. isolate EM1]